MYYYVLISFVYLYCFKDIIFILRKCFLYFNILKLFKDILLIFFEKERNRKRLYFKKYFVVNI